MRGLGFRALKAVSGMLLIAGCSNSSDPARQPAEVGSRFRQCQDQELGELQLLGGRLIQPQQVAIGRYEYLGSRLLVTQVDQGKTRAAVYVEDVVPRQGDPATQLLCTRGFGTHRLEAQVDAPVAVEIDRQRNWSIRRQRTLSVDMSSGDVVHMGNNLQQAVSWTPQELQKEMDQRRLQNGDLFLSETGSQSLDLVMVEETAKGGGIRERKTLRVRFRRLSER